MDEAGNVIPFPPQLRAVPVPAVVQSPVYASSTETGPLVDHDGSLYPLQDLLHSLTPEELRTVEAAVPRSGQEAWDTVVHNWPALAAEIVAGVPRAG